MKQLTKLPRVNLPRWGLKHKGAEFELCPTIRCKFTPLGFETFCSESPILSAVKCKFTPLGFETCSGGAIF